MSADGVRVETFSDREVRQLGDLVTRALRVATHNDVDPTEAVERAAGTVGDVPEHVREVAVDGTRTELEERGRL